MDLSLTPLEEEYRLRLLDLFSRVNPQKPEKGIRPLILKARQRMETDGLSEAQALEEMYQAALERTERRIRLLSSCQLKD